MAKIVDLPEPHPNQEQILNEAKRFNHIRCGRRWGKTSIMVYLMIPAITKGWKIGIWFPTYGDLFKIWRACTNFIL